ncbi:MAG: flagellar biosynthetic protein FliR [Planctomycetota bacterium]
MIDLTPILHHVGPWLMVLFRLSGLFLLTPVLGSATIPRYVKALLVVGLSLAVYGSLIAPGTGSAAHLDAVRFAELSIWVLLPLAAMELMIGYIIGYGVTLPIVGLQAGGEVVNQQMGLGIAGAYNPELDDQSGAIGQLLFLLGITLFLIIGGHLQVMRVLLDSFGHVPVGGMTAMDSVVELMLGLVASMMDILIKVAAPVLTLLFLESVAMGFITRTVPQIQILSVGFAVRILIAAGMMTVTVAAVVAVGQEGIEDALRQIKFLLAP